MSEHKNFVKMTVSGTPGTGTITLGAASTGYQSFASAYGADATVDVSITDGTAWEVANNCTYTNSGTTLTRGTFEASSTGSALSLTSAAIVTVTATAEFGRRMESAALNHVAGSDAATTMEVGNLYVIDGATLTADRTYTLPATAAVGDRVGVMMSAGSASYEVLLTAASGDTLNAVAGGTEWSRLFITGEVVIMRCVAASATWVVEHDGRIPQSARMYLSTSADGEAASTYTRPTAAATPGAWTSSYENASMLVTTNDRITPRRAGAYQLVVAYLPKDAGTSGNFVNLEIRRNGTDVIGGPSAVLTSVGVNRITATLPDKIVVGDYWDYWFRTQEGGRGAGGTTTWGCLFSVFEVLLT